MRLLIATTLLSVTLAGTAFAHIHLTYPPARTDSLTGDQKEQYCGVANQVRSTRVTELRPGASITVTWMETIQHPGHFRIAFQPNGSVFGIPPAAAGGGFPTLNQEGVDATNQSIVLKDRIPDGTLSATVIMPAMECSNCTLQFIQVMTDKPPYTTDALSDDIYFNCADITLSNTAPMSPDAGPGAGPDGGTDAGTPNGGQVDGGCASAGGQRWPVALALGLLFVRRRRSRTA